MGLWLGKRPNGDGGAGFPVWPPMGLTEPAGWAGGERPLMRPMKPPVGIQDLAASGLLEATRFAAAPRVKTAKQEPDAMMAGAAIAVG